MSSDRIIHDCPNASCTVPLTTGACLYQCWVRYKGDSKPPCEVAYWRHRGAHNDYIWAECSNCGFREENWKVVKLGKSDTDYVEVKWNYCPKCGKEMRI